MFQEVRNFFIETFKIIKLSAYYIRFNFMSAFEYKISFFTQVIFMALNDAIFLIYWMVLFKKIGTTINGYGLKEVMFLWSVVAVGFGASVIIFGNSNFISKIIYSGELDTYLLQPKSVLLNVLSSRTILSGWGDFIYGLVLFSFSQEATLKSVLLFFVFSVLVVIVFTSVRVFYHSLTFFLGNAEELAQTSSELVVAFSLYPGSVFKGPESWLLHSLIPAGLVAYIPAELFRKFNLTGFAVLVFSDLIILLISVLFFHIGLKRYESGNRIGARL